MSQAMKAWAPWLLLALGGLLAGQVIYPVLLMKWMCFAIFASAFNLLLGYTGLLSFGHAAFFGSAAYLYGYLVKDFSLSPLPALFAGVAMGAVLGLVVGLLAIRRQGIYFAMITLAMAQMVYFICLKTPQTGGEDGLQGIPRGELLGLDLTNDLNLYWVVLFLFMASLLFVHRVVNSPFGQVLRAIRENEARATSLGYDVARFKLLAFVLSAALAGLAGAMKAMVFNFASLTEVHWHMSGDVVLMTILGGIGTLSGPVLGSGVILLLEDLLAENAGAWVPVIMGAIFVVCVLIFRRGIVGEAQALYRRMVGERS
jgi:branched-chain amino acid transport system permease protein